MEEISFENDAFRISEELNSASVRESVRHIGQLNPVILLDQKPKMTVVCGFRRIYALREIGVSRAYSRIIHAENYDAARAFELALWDNLSTRQLDPLEKARVLNKLQQMCGMPRDRLISTYLPALGLAPSAKVLDAYISLNGIHRELRRCLIEDRLTLSSLESLAGLPAKIQESIASLMDRIRLSASLQKKFLSLLDELAARTGEPYDAPISEPQVAAILEDAGLSSYQKGERIHDALYRLANPRLSQAVELFQARKGSLNLPGAIRINAHPYFEDPGLRIDFEASDINRFRQLAAALLDAAQSPAAEELFKLD